MLKLFIDEQGSDEMVRFSSGQDEIDRHFLRALDAIQLGCAIVARDLLAPPDMRFISSDKDLLEAAQAEGFEVWNPAR